MFIEPTLVATNLQSNIIEEIFGPLMPIITYVNGYEILDIVNENPNPLALYVF